MRSDELSALGAGEAAERIRRGALSPLALVEACLERIGKLDGRLQAWAYLDEGGARATAREREQEAKSGRVRGPLHGVPIGAKDIFHVAGMPTAAGAKPFAHRRPSEDAASVALLRAAGAIILGKTHTTQFAHRDPAPTKNPWKEGHTPGGSSAGSAAAVAARMIPLALGSQTVGSVLRPAAYCGVVGVKPTHGLVPIAGVIPLAWSLDHVGVFGRSVADVALALSVLAGRNLPAEPGRPPRLALAPELMRRANAEVAGHVQAAADAFARAGATVTEVELPASFAELHAAGRVVLEAEAAAYHARDFAEHADDYGPEIRQAIEAGMRHGATAYVSANRTRLAFRDEIMPLLAAHDALLSPTAPGPAPDLSSTGDAWHCAPWSCAGVPSISLPSGLTPAGLPLAIQLTQAAGASARLLAAASWCEARLAFTRAPIL
jgi:Asp-tRNA(Asn)/Glu-tRNA(Gln) amidotransferase A subunit family amidase